MKSINLVKSPHKDDFQLSEISTEITNGIAFHFIISLL